METRQKHNYECIDWFDKIVNKDKTKNYVTRFNTPINRKKRGEMFKTMKEAGWDHIGLGVECGDPEFLNEKIGKRLNLEDSRHNLPSKIIGSD